MLVRRAFLAVSSLWAVSIPLATFVASRPGASSISYGFALSIYAIGHVVCHQLPARSFHLWMTSLPVCARCTGIYLGAAVTAMADTLDGSFPPLLYVGILAGWTAASGLLARRMFRWE